jgi:DNA-binding transcriptional LysR family regulator
MKEKAQGKLSFRAIEVFVAAIEEGSISKAAKRLGASASAVSLQLSNLEEVLDARLIERSSRRFQLTSAGELFAPRAKSILDEVSIAKAEMSSASYAPKMDINMAVMEDFDSEVLPHWIAKLQNEFPQCNFTIKSGASHENHAALSSREFDMIIAADNTTDIEWIEEHQVLYDPYILVASSPEIVSANIAKLMQHPFIRYSQEQLMGRQIEAQLRRTRNIPNKKYECSSTQAVFALVEQFNGWAITTASAYLGANKNNLFASAIPLPKFSRTIALYSRRDTMGEIPSRFSEHLRKSLEAIFIRRVEKSLPFIKQEVHLIETSENQNH